MLGAQSREVYPVLENQYIEENDIEIKNLLYLQLID